MTVQWATVVAVLVALFLLYGCSALLDAARRDTNMAVRHASMSLIAAVLVVVINALT